MGRTLILLETWNRQIESPVDIERAILLDFAMQHPRSLQSLVPELDTVVRAHSLKKYDLSDLFAQRHFGTTRERFLATIEDLIARDLVAESPVLADSTSGSLKPTAEGLRVAKSF
jgi:hypothetical protein